MHKRLLAGLLIVSVMFTNISLPENIFAAQSTQEVVVESTEEMDAEEVVSEQTVEATEQNISGDATETEENETVVTANNGTESTEVGKTEVVKDEAVITETESSESASTESVEDTTQTEAEDAEESNETVTGSAEADSEIENSESVTEKMEADSEIKYSESVTESMEADSEIESSESVTEVETDSETVTESVEESSETESTESEKAMLKNDISVKGTNSFGTFFANELEEAAAEQEENNGHNVFSIEVTDATAIVTFETIEDCTLVVGVYDETGTKMLGAGSLEVYHGETTAIVDIEIESMPQYFYLRGFLVENDSLRPLCTAYESSLYTQEMQEFLAKTTEDFDAEKVLNLDEDSTTNFAVYSDETIIVSQSTGANEVVTVDEENNIYVIENADESITSLQEGDIFSYEYAEEEVLIIKVASIIIEGTTATITGAETSMEEVFDYVKIDAKAGTADAAIDASTCAEGVTYEGLVDYTDSGAVQTYGVGVEGSVSKAFKVGLNKEIGEEGAKVELTGGLEMTVDCSVKLYISSTEKYLELKMDVESVVGITVEGEVESELPLVTLAFMYCGVIVEVTPSFVVETSGSITANGTLKGTVGFRASTNGIENLTTMPTFETEFKIEGTLFVGISLEPRMKILSKNIASVSLKAKVGTEVKAELELHRDDPEQKIKHTCAQCLDGDINAKITVSASIKLLNQEDLTFKLKLTGLEWKAGDFYYCVDKDEFAFTTCPYLTYRTQIRVIDEYGLPVIGATVMDSYTTNPFGMVTIYLQEGSYRIAAAKTGYLREAKNVQIMDDAVDVVIRLEIDGTGKIDGKKVKQISLGYRHSAAITEDGSLYMWGCNNYGQLGDESWEDSTVPKKVMDNVAAVSLGDEHSAAITEDGSLYVWGIRYGGQRGTITYGNEPEKIMNNVAAVSLGKSQSAAITSDGSLYMWGSNYYGQLGDGSTTNSYEPKKIMNNVVAVSLGAAHSAAITSDRSLYMWGWNYAGQLGDGSTTDSYVPKKVMDNVTAVNLGYSYSGAITADRSLYMWGFNDYGELGNGLTEHSYEPKKIMDNVVTVSFGQNHSAAITADGSLYMWGYNYDGRLGDGTTENSYVPKKIMSNVTAVSLGSWHSAAITTDGSLYMWGDNSGGQLGNGTTDNSLIPIPITNPTSATTATSLSTEDTTQNTLVTTEASTIQAITITNNTNTTTQTASFTDLLPNECYNFYVMKSKSAENVLSTENLLYIGQSVSDSSGNISIVFEAKESYENADSFVVGVTRTEISGAAVTVSDLDYDGTEKYITPKVTYKGVELIEGKDYELTSGYSATEIGTYTVTITGIGAYTGRVTAQYRMVCTHTYSDTWITEKEATCIAEGSKYQFCTKCNAKSELTVIPKNEHKYSEKWTIDKEATCIQEGSKSHHCTECDAKSDITIIAKTPHSYSASWIIDKEATCTKEGSKSHHCTECDAKSDITVIAKTPHSYSASWIIDKKATCTVEGSKSHHCTECGAKSDITVIAKTPHSYSASWIIDKEATCTKEGSKSHHCTECDAKSDITVIAKTGHEYKNVKVIKKATTNMNGKVEQKCSVCSKKKTVTTYVAKSVRLSTTSYTYSGKARKPSVTVKDSKGKKLKANTDYTLSYAKGRKTVGKYTVTVKLKGKYSGTIKKTFTIKPQSTSISKLSASKKGFTVKWKKQKTQTSGYEIQYSTSSKFIKSKTATVKITKNSTTSKKITKLKAKKKYYVRIRTYKTVKVNGKSTKIYSSWSKVKNVTTKK